MGRKTSTKNRKRDLVEYSTWRDMRSRCTNPHVKNYKNYGGRGISVCERWNDFDNFLADMGYRPGAKYSIHRINNDGNYEPDNCKWATWIEQASNRRTREPKAKKNKPATVKSTVKLPGFSIREVARIFRKHPGTIRAWIRRQYLQSRQKTPNGAHRIEIDELRRFAIRYNFRLNEELIAKFTND